MFRILILVACLTGAWGQLRLNGTCEPNAKGIDDLRIKRLEGRFFPNEVLGDASSLNACPYIYLSIRSKKISAITYVYIEEGATQSTYYGGFTKTTGQGNFIMNEQPFSSNSNGQASYLVLDTDHDEYMLLYYCKQDTPDTKTVSAFKMSSNPVLSAEHARDMNEVASRYPELRDGPWKISDYSRCTLRN